MHLSAIAYNLKKYLRFITKTVQSDVQSLGFVLSGLYNTLKGVLSPFGPTGKDLKFTAQIEYKPKVNY